MLIVFHATAWSSKSDDTQEVRGKQQTVRQTIQTTALRGSRLILTSLAWQPTLWQMTYRHQKSIRCCLPAAIPVSLSSLAASAARAASRLRLMVSRVRSSKLNSGCHALLCRMHFVSEALLYSSCCHLKTLLHLCPCAQHGTTQSEICLSKRSRSWTCPELACWYADTESMTDAKCNSSTTASASHTCQNPAYS